MEGALVLIVEDDPKLGALLQEYLESQGLRVVLEPRGDRAVERARAESPDLVVLDWMLPGRDGLAVCQELRPWFPGSILMLTSRKTEVDQIVGLEVGADDYITKPVEPRLLLARIRSHLRADNRRQADPEVADIVLGPVTVSRTTREATIDGEPISLTAVEFDLLYLLASRAGEVVSREELYQELRGIAFDGIDRGMDIHVSRLRRKLSEGGAPDDLIKSVRGAGYFAAGRS